MSNSEYIFVYWIGSKTTLSSTHDRLSEFVTIGCHITCRIESFYICLLSLIDNDTSFCVFLWWEMIDESSIWNISHSDEYPIKGKCGSVFEKNWLHSHHISLYLCYFGEVVEYDIRVLFCFFYPDILSSNPISSDEDMDFAGNLCQIEGLSDCCIPPAHNRHREISKEVPITGGTIGYPLSDKFYFARNTEFFILVSCSENHSFWIIDSSVGCCDSEIIFAIFRHRFDTFLEDGRTSRSSMISKTLHNRFSTIRLYARPILDTVTRCKSSTREFADDDIGELVAAGIHTCWESSTSSADDDGIVDLRHRGILL